MHLAKVKELSIKRLNDKTQTELTEEDLLTMKNAYEVYKNFKENLANNIVDEFTDEINSVDVTEQFFSQYNLGTQTFGKTKIFNLSDEV